MDDKRVLISEKRQFYKAWSFPIMKVFLVAMFTYQLTYFGWLKLETMDEKERKDGRQLSFFLRLISGTAY
jgi:hypothetical protein